MNSESAALVSFQCNKFEMSFNFAKCFHFLSDQIFKMFIATETKNDLLRIHLYGVNNCKQSSYSY